MIDSQNHECLLNIHTMNLISYLITTETSEPAPMSEGLAERKAALGGYMSTEFPVIAWSSEIDIVHF